MFSFISKMITEVGEKYTIVHLLGVSSVHVKIDLSTVNFGEKLCIALIQSDLSLILSICQENISNII